MSTEAVSYTHLDVYMRQDHGRIIMSQNIQFQQIVVNGVVVEVGGNNSALHIIGRMLHRCKLIDIMSVRENNNSSRVLSRTSPDPGTSLGNPFDLTLPLALPVLLIIVFHKAIGRLICQSSDSSGLKGCLLYTSRCV